MTDFETAARALIDKWRIPCSSRGYYARSAALRVAADELEALLPAQPLAEVEAGTELVTDYGHGVPITAVGPPVDGWVPAKRSSGGPPGSSDTTSSYPVATN